ncbi:MAG: ImmA/IrrE family metallo-endopeptidase [Limisphaerales bacterium]
MKSLLVALKLVILWSFLVLATDLFAQSSSDCESCLNKVKRDESDVLTSFDDSFKKRVCYSCMEYAPRCFVCKLPSARNSRFVEDKRLFCDRDLQSALFAYNEMDRLAHQTTLDLNRLFWRFNMNFAASNLTVSMVSSATLYDLLQEPFHPQRASTCGLTVTRCYDAEGNEVKFRERHKKPAGTPLRYEHEVYVASGFPLQKMRAILAHELAHVWLHENLPFERANNIDRHTEEAFCELVAYHLMDQENVVNVKAGIRKNLYTMGQQNILIEVESNHGFNRILEWFFKGTGRRLNNVDQVREINEARETASKPAQPVPAAPAEAAHLAAPPKPAPLPETVLLKGIFLGRHKSALVNNVTLSEGEEQMVRLATGLMPVKCVEIRPTSVILAVNGEAMEYFVGLPPKNIASGESK